MYDPVAPGGVCVSSGVQVNKVLRMVHHKMCVANLSHRITVPGWMNSCTS